MTPEQRRADLIAAERFAREHRLVSTIAMVFFGLIAAGVTTPAAVGCFLLATLACLLIALECHLEAVRLRQLIRLHDRTHRPAPWRPQSHA